MIGNDPMYSTCEVYGKSKWNFDGGRSTEEERK